MEQKEFEEVYTYNNLLGKAMLRRCLNCKFWSQELETEKVKELGYCKNKPYLFSFTLLPTVFPMTKSFYLCPSHEFLKEEEFKAKCEVVKQSEYLIRK